MSDLFKTGGHGGYEFLEDIAIADIALRVWGDTLTEVFRQAARATMEVMVDDLATIEPRQQRDVSLTDDDVGMLLFDFLQELIFYKDVEQLVLLPAHIDVSESHGQYRLEATLAGETIDPARHPVCADVKAVTMHRFNLCRDHDGIWRAELVLDI